MTDQSKKAKPAISRKNVAKFLRLLVLLALCAGLLSLVLYQGVVIQKTQTQLAVNQLAIKNQSDLVKTNQSTLVYLLKAFRHHKDTTFLIQIDSIANAAYLSLNVQHNIPETLALFKVLKSRVQKLKGVDAAQITDLLDQNIAQLESLEMSNVPLIFSEVQAVDDHIDGLVFNGQIPSTQVNIPQKDISKKQSSWKQALTKSWDSMKQFLVIRKSSYPVKLVLSQQAEQDVKLNLHLYLAQAQTALLQRHKSIYQTSLKNASRMIQEYGSIKDPNVQSLLAQLKKLVLIDVTPKPSNINQTLAKIEKLV